MAREITKAASGRVAPERLAMKKKRLRKQETEMKQNKFPPDWDEQRVRAVIEHYERQTDDEAVAEYQAAQAPRSAGDLRAADQPSEKSEEYDADGE